MAELRCEGLAKSYGDRPVLSDIDLVVPEGTLTAILGASGSGKTTLLRVIIGFIPADAGAVSIGGRVVANASGINVPPNKREIGYVAQEGALFPHLTVAENVSFGLPRSERKRSDRVGEALDLVGLHRDYADRRSNELSGGEQRRVALARALAPRPKMVLLDEPFSGLDAALRADTRRAVVNALASEGTTAVLVTHDQSEALSMGREVAVLRAGRLVQAAAPADLYRSPVDLDVAHFVGEAVVLPASVRSGRVECALGSLLARGSEIEGPAQAMIRPEQIRLSHPRTPTAEHGTPGRMARVVGHNYFGPDTMVQLELENLARTPVVARTFDQEVPAVGEVVELSVAGPVAIYPDSVDPDAIHPERGPAR